MSKVKLRARLPEGTNRSGCGACGEVFTGITAFDAHRNRGRGKDRACQPPAEVGLVLTDRDEPVWGFPPPEVLPDAWKKKET